MEKSIVKCLLLIFVIGLVNSDDHGETAVSYNKETFDSAIAGDERLFVMFFAPWCGHCKRLAPTWDDLAHEYNAEGRKVTVGKVDCTQETGLCGEHSVRGYPTVKFFNKNNVGIKYTNSRTIEDLKAYVEEMLAAEEEGGEEKKDDQVKDAEDKTPEDVDAVVKDGLYDLTDSTFDAHIAKGHHFIKFYAPWCGHCKRLAPTWEELAGIYTATGSDKVRIAKVDCTAQPTTCSKYSIRGYPTLIWFTNGEKSENYNGQRTLEDMSKFVTKMTSAESETAKMSKDGKVPDVIKDEPEVDGGEEKKDDQVKEVEDKKPEVVDAVVKDGLYDLTDSTFDAHIAKGHHFIKFYAPWCGHCKRLAPTWEELASIYSGIDKVRIAKVDCTAQPTTCSKHSIKGYPTLIWFTNGEKSQDYNGQRSMEDLSKFVTQMTIAESESAKDADVPNIVEDEPEVGVVQLTNEDFVETVSEDYTFVVYIGDVSQSAAILPRLEELAEQYIDETEMLVAMVDCSKNADTCRQQLANGPYPAFMMYHSGAAIDTYEGDQTLTAMTTYVDEQMKKFGGEHDEL